MAIVVKGTSRPPGVGELMDNGRAAHRLGQLAMSG